MFEDLSEINQIVQGDEDITDQDVLKLLVQKIEEKNDNNNFKFDIKDNVHW